MSLTTYTAGQILTAASLNSNLTFVDQDGTNNKNVIINGAMQVTQRGTSVASITTNGYYTADRWRAGVATMGTWTQSVENDAPTGSGFRKSLKMLCTTADASPAAGDLVILGQRLEGQNLQQFLKGTASAKQWSLTFWVKSNVTGTYVVRIADIDNTRGVSASYTVSASGTWEKKTITFPADTTGAFDNDNALSAEVFFWLGAGTDYTSGTLATTWASTVNANTGVGQTNVAAATNNYWQITGVQLEASSVATAFEFEDYGTTLAKCQRYYCKSFPEATAPAQNVGSSNGALWAQASGTGQGAVTVSLRFPVVMRGSPTLTLYSPDAATSNWGGTGTPTSTADNIGDRGCRVRNVGTATDTSSYYIHFDASAEL